MGAIVATREAQDLWTRMDSEQREAIVDDPDAAKQIARRIYGHIGDGSASRVEHALVEHAKRHLWRVVRRVRGNVGQWVYGTSSYFADETAARAFAEEYAAEQASVPGAEVMISAKLGSDGLLVRVAS